MNLLALRRALRVAAITYLGGCVGHEQEAPVALKAETLAARPRFYREITFHGLSIALHPSSYHAAFRRIARQLDCYESAVHAVCDGKAESQVISAGLEKELLRMGAAPCGEPALEFGSDFCRDMERISHAPALKQFWSRKAQEAAQR